MALLGLCAGCGPAARQASTPCTGTVVYDAIGANISEVTHLQHQLAFVVSKRAKIDETTQSETGGALVVGNSPNVVWLEWPLGIAMSSRFGPFETPQMRCVTRPVRSDRTQTKCVSKQDGSLWLEYVSDARGVYEYQRPLDSDFPYRMRRRGNCGLSFEALAKLPKSERL
jgi:hypothetical protein